MRDFPQCAILVKSMSTGQQVGVMTMKLSSDRILTTHVGSLPRSAELVDVMVAKREGRDYDQAAFDVRVREDVAAIVRKQVETGIDVVSDGELSKISYATYVAERFTGFGGTAKGRRSAKDLREYRAYGRRLVETGGTIPSVGYAACDGPVELADKAFLEADLANFRQAVDAAAPVEAFLNAASPGVIAIFIENQHYPSHEAYVQAVAEAMRVEYEAIVEAGFLLQIDSPDLAMGRHILFGDDDEATFRRNAQIQVEALNHATANIAPEKMRLHLCWGNYQGPHHCDIPLANIIDIVLQARPAAISMEGANPRHSYEWVVFRDNKLPDDKLLLPGVIDSTSNFIEHPETVAQRICRYADVVGRERVIASSDCGFSTFAGFPQVDPEIAWAKMGSLVEGAARASDILWR